MIGAYLFAGTVDGTEALTSLKVFRFVAFKGGSDV